MQGPENNQEHPLQRMKTAAHVTLFVARAMATPLELCLRREFGRNYFGFQALAAFILVPVCIAWWPGYSPNGLVGLWYVMLFMLVRARFETMRLIKQGKSGHSYYNGYPRLAAIFRKKSEVEIKGLYEPALGLVAGGLIANLDEPLGYFLIASAFALFLSQGVIEAVEQARAEQLNDALIDQQQLAERFRKLGGR